MSVPEPVQSSAALGAGKRSGSVAALQEVIKRVDALCLTTYGATGFRLRGPPIDVEMNVGAGALITSLVLAAGILLFSRTEKTFIDTV